MAEQIRESLITCNKERMDRMTQWALMTANYVSRELNYQLKGLEEWNKGYEATARAFHGPEFAGKFEEIVVLAKESGFRAIELWSAHFDPVKATPQMVKRAQAILKKHEMKVLSYAAGFGEPGLTKEEAAQVFETAQKLGAHCLAQALHPDNGQVVMELAKEYGIRMGLENHPEKTPQEVISKVKKYSPWVGIALDTGWFATQGYDPVKAVYEIKDYLVHVHLKDVTAFGTHDTCTLGNGAVDIKGVLRALKSIDYDGNLSIEHEPFDYDPTEDVRISLVRAKEWWDKA